MMQWLVEQFIERPVSAFVSSVEILGQGLQGGQTIDAVVSRIIHTLSCTSGRTSEMRNGATIDDREVRRKGPGSHKTWE
jgi:hypothetical protein